jgi:hypothetical protein
MNFHIATTKWSIRPHAVQFFGKKGNDSGKPYAPVTRCGRVVTGTERRRFDMTDPDACARCIRSIRRAERLAAKK